MMIDFLDLSKRTQQEKYSPTPKIKIKKWYQTVCTACIHLTHDYGEYDTVGWHECEEKQKLSNLKCFPYCSANSCKNFIPICLSHHDGWCYLEDFQNAFGKEKCYEKLRAFLDFNKRMGDYKVGRIA